MTQSQKPPYFVMVVAAGDGATFYGPFASRAKTVLWYDKNLLVPELDGFILDASEFAQNILDFGPATINSPETFDGPRS